MIRERIHTNDSNINNWPSVEQLEADLYRANKPEIKQKKDWKYYKRQLDSMFFHLSDESSYSSSSSSDEDDQKQPVTNQYKQSKLSLSQDNQSIQQPHHSPVKKQDKQTTLSLETGLILVPYVASQCGLVLGTLWLVGAYFITLMSFQMYLKISEQNDKGPKEDQKVVEEVEFNYLIIIHKNFKSNFIISYFLRFFFMVYYCFQMKIYYYSIFLMPLWIMQTRQHNYMEIVIDKFSYDNVELMQLLETLYNSYCCFINFFLFICVIFLIYRGHTLLLGYVKLVLVVVSIIFIFVLIFSKDFPLELTFFDYALSTPIYVTTQSLAAMTNNTLLCLFYVFKNHKQFIKQPKIFEKYHQLFIFGYYFLYILAANPYIDTFVYCDMKFGDLSSVPICKVSLVLQTVTYLLSCMNLANIFYNNRLLILGKGGILTINKYFLGLKMSMVVNIIHLFLVFMLMVSSIYDQQVNNILNCFLVNLAIFYEIIIPMIILTQLAKIAKQLKYLVTVLILVAQLGLTYYFIFSVKQQMQ